MNKLRRLLVSQHDIIWFIYFTVMLNFYTFTYVQLAAQLLLLMYTFFQLFQNGGIILHRVVAKRLLAYVLWYGLFSGWCFLSNLWIIYPAVESPNTLLGVFRIFIMGACIVYDVKDKYSFFKLLKVFIYSGIFFTVLTIVSNPVSDWGNVSFCSFGDGFMRNGVSNICAYLICLTGLFWKQLFSRRIRNLSILIFGITLLLCGSRRAIILVAITSLLFVLFIPDIGKKLKYIIIGFFAVLAVLFMAYNIPTLKSLYVDRILEMFSGTESTDLSTVGRTAYIIIGMDMMSVHPWIGWGTDAFYNYILKNPYAYASNMALRAVYSHNNYIEIGTSYGIIGLILFYAMHIKTLLQSWKYRKTDLFSKTAVIILVAMMIGDYGAIDFSSHIPMYILIFVQCMCCLAKEEKNSHLEGIET